MHITQYNYTFHDTHYTLYNGKTESKKWSKFRVVETVQTEFQEVLRNIIFFSDYFAMECICKY